jgi:hypothetical protein
MVVYPHPPSLPLCNFLSLWLSLGWGGLGEVFIVLMFEMCVVWLMILGDGWIFADFRDKCSHNDHCRCNQGGCHNCGTAFVLLSECCSWTVDHCNSVPLNQQWTLHFLHMFSTYVQCELRALMQEESCHSIITVWSGICTTWIVRNLGLTKTTTQWYE